MTQHRIPSHIGVARRTWLRNLLNDHTFTDSEWSLAVLAAECYDRAQTCRRQLSREGLTVTNRFGELRPHPLVAVARDAITLYSRLLRQLELDEAAEDA